MKYKITVYKQDKSILLYRYAKDFKTAEKVRRDLSRLQDAANIVIEENDDKRG